MSGRGSPAWNGENIPVVLREASRWVAWRYIERDGRATKMPVCARNGGAASVTDPETWCDYASVSAYARARGCGIGIVMGSGIAGVDLDNCVSETAELTPWARTIVAGLDSYAEISPSGRGVHVLVHGTLPDKRRRRASIEMYDRDRYLCVTGNHLRGTPRTVEERTKALAALHRRVFGNASGDLANRSAAAVTAGPGASDGEVIERAHRARNGDRFARLWAGNVSEYASASEADLALCSMLAWYTDDADQIARLVARSGLAREKWQRADYRQRTIAAALTSAGTRRRVSAERVARTENLLAQELGI
jgi:putative DNA primase/helicase